MEIKRLKVERDILWRKLYLVQRQSKKLRRALPRQDLCSQLIIIQSICKTPDASFHNCSGLYWGNYTYAPGDAVSLSTSKPIDDNNAIKAALDGGHSNVKRSVWYARTHTTQREKVEIVQCLQFWRALYWIDCIKFPHHSLHIDFWTKTRVEPMCAVSWSVYGSSSIWWLTSNFEYTRCTRTRENKYGFAGLSACLRVYVVQNGGAC